MTYPYCLIPDIQFNQIDQKLYNSAYLLMPMAQAIVPLDTYRASISGSAFAVLGLFL
ncbi:MAG: hypothetical protein V8Q86_09715 [Blautia sp.]